MLTYQIFFSINQNDKKDKLDLINFLDLNFKKVDQNAELIFIIGGDGFFLEIIKKYKDKNVKIVFINAGNLGFYASFNLNQLPKKELLLDENNYISINYLLIKENNLICFNDFSIQSDYAQLINVFVDNLLVQSFSGNGFLIATPFGSSARNRSLTGPLLLPGSNSLVISEIEGINNHKTNTLKQALVICDKSKIKFIVIESKDINKKDKLKIFIDGLEEKLSINEINIISNKSKFKLFILNGEKKGYLNLLKKAFL